MAFMSGGGAAMTRVGNVYEGHRQSLYRDDETCGCLPKIERKNTRNKRTVLKERIRQFSIWYFENEEHRETEHVRRRQDRKKKRKLIKRMKGGRLLKWLYFTDGALWTVGLIVTLCSTVETIGEYTPFYEERDKYRVIGPLTLLLAVILMLTLSVIKRKYLKANKMAQPKRRFYIMPKKVRKNADGIKKCNSCDTDDSGNFEDIEVCEQPTKENVWAMKTENNIGHELAIARELVEARNDREGVVELNDTTHWLAEPLSTNIIGRADKRKAWAKTKWMRMDLSSESNDTIEDQEQIFGQGKWNNTFTHVPKNSTGRCPILSSVSVDSDEIQTPFQRVVSTKSKTSEVSNFSNFSETAPLVKK